MTFSKNLTFSSFELFFHRMDKLKKALRGTDDASAANDEERGIIAEALDASSLSWSTRIKGFIACFALGLILSVLSTILFALTYNLVNFREGIFLTF